MSARTDQAQRDAAARRLSAEYVAGALSTDTFEARVAKVLSARTEHELDRSMGRPLRAPTPVEVVAARGEESILLGRSSSCDRIFDDDAVSRRHALLRLDRSDVWQLIDLASTNGTWLNGRPVRSRSSVVNGDEIRLGDLRLKLRFPT